MADVNQDGKFNLADITYVMKKLMEIKTSAQTVIAMADDLQSKVTTALVDDLYGDGTAQE